MDSSQAISTKYFHDLLQSETGKFDNLCDIWTKVINEQKSIPEEVLGQIRTTIGQAHLLKRERFKQFESLVKDCELKRGEKETKLDDLQGFWDMIFFQVEDVHKKFEVLKRLEENKWVSKQTATPKPVAKTAQKQKVPISKENKATSKPATANTAYKTTKPVLVKPRIQSTLRSHILALKKNKKPQSDTKLNDKDTTDKENLKTFEAPGFFVLNSPVRIATSKVVTKKLSHTPKTKLKDSQQVQNAN